MNCVKPASAARAGHGPHRTATNAIARNHNNSSCISVSSCIYWTYTMIDLDQIPGFDWDDGNNRKSADKHDVSQAEAESVFFNDPLIVVEDARHRERDQRFNALGTTTQNPLLRINLTLQQNGSMYRAI